MKVKAAWPELPKGKIVSRRTGKTSRNQAKCQKARLWFEHNQQAGPKGLMAMIRIRLSPQVIKVFNGYDSNTTRKTDQKG